MKKILAAAILFFLASVSSVSACGNFKILSEYGVPVFDSYGYMIINGSEYPAGQKMILYNMTVDNDDTVGVDLTFTPTGDLVNFVYGTSGYVPANSVETISMYVYVDGPLREGQIFVEGSCDNGYVEGSIPVLIYGRGNAMPPTCGSTDYSCGVYPNCVNVKIQDGCDSNGYMRYHFCSNNLIKFNEECTSYCCGLAGGTCSNGVCNPGSGTTSTTTTTLPSSTTTTIQAGCTQSLALSMNGCYSGYLRAYFCSGNNLKYTECCFNYCCGLISGACNNGICNGGSASTTTTTLPTTTTTIPSSSCTTASALKMNGCYSGYLRAYFCSGSLFKYTESCFNYCCGLISGSCQNGVCVK